MARRITLRVVRLLADLEDAGRQPLQRRGCAPGRLQVDVPSPLASLVLIPALPAFHAQYPDIQLHLGVSDRVVDIVSDQVDCVVRGGTVTNPSLIARHVGDLALRVYAAPSYLQRWGRNTPPNWKGRTTTPWALWARTGKPLPCLPCAGATSRCRPRAAVCAVDDGNAYLAAGLAGLGVLWLPTDMAKPHVAGAPWCRCLLTGRWTPCPCTSPTHRTATSAPSCACSSIGGGIDGGTRAAASPNCY